MSVIISVHLHCEPSVPDTQFFRVLSHSLSYTLLVALRSFVSWMSLEEKKKLKLKKNYRTTTDESWLGYISLSFWMCIHMIVEKKKNNKKLLCFFFVSPFNILISFNIQHLFVLFRRVLCGDSFFSAKYLVEIFFSKSFFFSQVWKAAQRIF